MSVSISGASSELGVVLAQQAGVSVARHAHFCLAGQRANTLLHDGHAWKGFARQLQAETRHALQTAREGGAQLLVHASFAFIHACESGAALAEPLGSAARAIEDCESLVLAGPVPACVVRLGYLYGPHSADLRAYRGALALHRPYWAGPAEAQQYHLHQFDAAAALLAAARTRHVGKTLYATTTPVSFMRFMDAFALRVGRTRPLHLPLWTAPLARLVVRQEHMQQTALAMPPAAPEPRVPGWRPRFADYRKGLDQVIQAWGS